jgi:hypothetical protein
MMSFPIIAFFAFIACATADRVLLQTISDWDLLANPSMAVQLRKFELLYCYTATQKRHCAILRKRLLTRSFIALKIGNCMKPLFICLLCAPSVLIGQSNAVTRFQQELRNSQRGMFVLLEDESAILSKKFRELTQEEGLAELKLNMRVVRTNNRQSELADYLRSRFSWESGSHWAFVGPDERCLAQGMTPPDAQALADQLAQAGIESPIRRLRAFTRQYPENIDGKLALLKTLRSIAEERTRGTLGIESNNRLGGGFSQFGDTRRPSRMGDTRRSSPIFEQAGALGSKEKPVQLSAENDLRIWVKWADEFDKLMADEQWLESDFTFDYEDEFLDAHSPIVRGIYKKRIGLVEDALRRWPASDRIWSVWLHMSLVLGDRSIKEFVNGLTPMPDTIPGTWPPYTAKLMLIQEARRKGDWRDLRNLLWDSWLQASQALSMVQRSINASGLGNQTIMRFIPRIVESQWQELIDPLLESLLMSGDIAGADSVVNQLKESAGWEDMSDLAVAIATRCQMAQVAARWKQ